ncbi:unnamed protein product [Moneuplotes crassus]|uniref:Uncharacterized protein n=1 Tax=Euplotes crassus TaxID=5936 RepID=A0AAD1UC00_EUPCR|nr:unnamed protein product [Moneuplotes crassus]
MELDLDQSMDKYSVEEIVQKIGNMVKGRKEYEGLSKKVAGKEEGGRGVIKEIMEDEKFREFCVRFTLDAIGKGAITTLDQADFPDFSSLGYLRASIKSQRECIRNIKRQFSKIYERNLKTESLSTTNLNTRFHSLSGYLSYLNSNSAMSLQMDKEYSIKFAKSLMNYRLPKCSEIYLYSVHKRPELTKNILKRSFPEQIEGFSFDNRGVDFAKTKKINIGRYLKELSQVIPNVTHRVTFKHFEINQYQLSKLFYLSREKKQVGFRNCRIHLKTPPDLSKSLKGCKIETLNFDSCGESQYSDWETHPEYLCNLIESLSQCPDLQDSLTQISLCWIKVPKEIQIKIFEQHPFKKATVYPYLTFSPN